MQSALAGRKTDRRGRATISNAKVAVVADRRTHRSPTHVKRNIYSRFER